MSRWEFWRLEVCEFVRIDPGWRHTIRDSHQTIGSGAAGHASTKARITYQIMRTFLRPGQSPVCTVDREGVLHIPVRAGGPFR